MKIKSVFKNNEQIPVKYTGDGEDINPPLEISEAPADVKSFALIIDDPDAPAGDWVHWIVFNISSNFKIIEENSVPSGALLGMNDMKKLEYHGPCPPRGTHRYFFKLYALDIILNLSSGARKQELLNAMEAHIIDKAELVGLYSR